MTVPKTKVSRTDGALKIAPANTAGINMVCGTSSAGTANIVEQWSDGAALYAAHGFGTAVQAACDEIDKVGSCYTCFVSSDVAGAIGTVTETGTSPSITFTGTPNDDYHLVVAIPTGGAIGASAFTYSVDGGKTTSLPITTASTYVIPNTGVTINFAAGTYNKGDTAIATCSAPYYDATALAAVQTAILASKVDFGMLHLVGCAQGANDAAKATACLAIATAAATIAAAFDAIDRPIDVLVDAPDVAASALVTAFASANLPSVLVSGDFCDLVSALDKRTYKRPSAWVYASRVAKIPIQEHPGRVQRGPLPAAVAGIYTADPTTLDGARFITLRTVDGQTGFFITRGPMLVDPTSDYAEHQRKRVINRATRLAKAGLNFWMNEDLEVKDDGALETAQANTIDSDLNFRLRDLTQTNAARATQALVTRTNDVATTGALLGKFRVKPKGYATDIEFEIGFSPIGS